MENTLIVLFEENELTVQIPHVISKGVLKVIERNNPDEVIIIKKIINTDFLQIKVNLPPGRYQFQVITLTATISKNIEISKNQR